MARSRPELYFYLASYNRWNESEEYPLGFFQALRISNMGLDLLDIKDPPRRSFTGDKKDVELWLDPLGQEWSQWLFGKKRSKENLNVTIHLANRQLEAVKSRGDYHYLYGSIKTDEEEKVKLFWQSMCQSLSPFHGFLDTINQYNCRAHTVKADGSIEKVTGWYRRFLPGFSAFNYFGPVYLKNWGFEIISKLPPDPVERDHKGLFVFAPSGLREKEDCSDVYSEKDFEIIETIGTSRFRLPDRFTFDPNAPQLEDYLSCL